MQIRTVVCGAGEANSYLVWVKGGEELLMIDAGDDLEKLKKAVEQTGKKLTAIVLTHGHYDHILAAKPLRDEYGCKIYMHELDAKAGQDMALNLYNPRICVLPFEPFEPDVVLKDDRETLSVCGMDFKVLHTPGHTKGGICLYSEKDRVLFSGDTLFSDDYGRCDLPGGSLREMRMSLRTLLHLPGDVVVYPGHYGNNTIKAISGKWNVE